MSHLQSFIFKLNKNSEALIAWAGVVNAVGKISAFQPQGPQFNPGSAEIWIFVDLLFRLS